MKRNRLFSLSRNDDLDKALDSRKNGSFGVKDINSLKPVSKFKYNVLLPIVSVFAGAVLAFSLPPLFIEAAINPEINYQAKLTDDDGVAVADGDYSIVFKLYTVPTGGSAFWTETQTITATSGLFSVLLGSEEDISSVNFNQTIYLGVNVEGDGEMTPRKKIGSVPTAFTADKLDGLDSTDFLSTSTAAAPKLYSLTGLGEVGSTTATTTFIGVIAVNSTVSTSTIAGGLAVATTGLVYDRSTGNVGIGTASPTSLLQLSSPSGTGTAIRIDNTDAGGRNYLIFSSGSENVGGAGNLMIRDGTADENRITLNSSGNFGIGTTTPNWLLQVAATRPFFTLSDTAAAANLKHWTVSSQGGNLYFATSSDVYATSTTATLTIDKNGFVGVKKTVPDTALDVSGTASSTGLQVNGSGTITSSLTLGTALAVTSGGTGWGNVQANTVLLGNGTSALATTSAGTDGFVLSLVGGVPTWQATTTLSTISGTLGVVSGGTGATTFGQGWLHSSGGTNAITSSTSPTVAYLTATSTTATTSISTGGFAVGDTHLIVQSSSGRVGIGTTTPNWLLQVAATRPFFTLSDTAAAANLKHWTVSSQGGNLYFATSSDVYATSTTATLTIDKNGFVGIKKTTPSVTGVVFEVNGDAYVGGNNLTVHGLSEGGSNVVCADNNGVLFLVTAAVCTLGVGNGGTGATTFGQGWLHSSGGTNAITSSTSPTVLSINATSTTATSTFAATIAVNSTVSTSTIAGGLAVATTGLVYDRSTGFVGIGTASPSTKLEVNGTVTATLFSGSGASLSSLDAGNITAGTLLVTRGGTGWGNVQANTVLLGNGTSALATTSAGTDGFVLSLVGGVPTWQATTTLSTISGTLGVVSGGTGATTFGQGWLHSSGGTNAITSSTSPTVLSINATSTTATSTFAATIAVNSTVSTSTIAGGLAVATTGLVYDRSTGFVGIGTASPTSLFHISSLSTTGTALRIDNTDTGGRSYLIFSSGSANAGGAGNLVIRDATGAANRVAINSSGNVGIGTTTPNWLLQVAGTRPFFTLSDTAAAANQKHWTVSSQGGSLYFATSSDVYATSTIAALTINKNGFVGIKNANPDVELTVDGSVSISGGLSVGGLGEGPAIVCASGGNLFLDDGGVVPCDADLTPWLIDENGLAVKIASSLKNLEGTYKKTVYGSRFIIENREEETHYFDQIYLEQRIIRGRRMTVKKYYADSPDADLINNADETYLVLRQGDRVDFSFDIPPRERAGEFQLVVKGWYEKLSGIGSQQGQEVITLPEDDDNQPEPSANSISLPILESEQAISTVESSIKKDTLSPADTEATEETPDDDNNTGEILPDTQTEPQPAPPPEAIPEQETGGASTSTAQEASKEPEPKGDKPPENP